MTNFNGPISRLLTRVRLVTDRISLLLVELPLATMTVVCTNKFHIIVIISGFDGRFHNGVNSWRSWKVCDELIVLSEFGKVFEWFHRETFRQFADGDLPGSISSLLQVCINLADGHSSAFYRHCQFGNQY